MTVTRLSHLDTSFLDVETPSAHMHVGWAARLRPPEGAQAPPFEAVRDHIAARLGRAPRYRQRLLGVPLGLNDPVWVDDERFDVDRHVVRCSADTLGELAAAALSTPLPRHRPLWEVWVADGLADGTLGIVGKAHHCLVDGIAAVELAVLMLDPEGQTEPPADDWRPRPAPGLPARTTAALVDRARDAAALAIGSVRAALAPRRTLEAMPGAARGMAGTLTRALAPAPRSPTLNPDTSALRALGTVHRPLADLRPLRRRHGATVNDVVLAACAGAIGRMLARHGERPGALKAMVPVTVREDGAAAELGNRISFLFVDLPCGQRDPVARLRAVMETMGAAKREATPQGGDALLGAVRFLPRPLHAPLARLIASPRTFNVVVSNIPGPAGGLQLLGARLEHAFPVVPLAEEHALAIGVTSIGGELCFGLHADRLALPDVAALESELARALDELVTSADGRFSRRREQPVGDRPQVGVEVTAEHVAQ